MNVPSTDFMALMYIVPPNLHRCEPVSSLKRGADSLETAKFVDFWQVRDATIGGTVGVRARMQERSCLSLGRLFYHSADIPKEGVVSLKCVILAIF